MNDQKQHLIKALQNNIRLDGRKNDEFRPVTVTTGVSSTAEGSAHVKIGNTEVIAGVKMAIEKPFSDTPDEGVLMVNAELLPMSNPIYESGPPSRESIELSRVIDRGIRESKSFDRKQLCIEPGEKVWSVAIDIIPVNDDGNMLDAGSLAALAALLDARFPKVVDGKVDYHQKTGDKLPLRKLPISVTAVKIGNQFIVDPTMAEQQLTDARLTMILVGDTIHAMQKNGEATLTIDEVGKVIELVSKNKAKLESFLKQP